MMIRGGGFVMVRASVKLIMSDAVGRTLKILRFHEVLPTAPPYVYASRRARLLCPAGRKQSHDISLSFPNVTCNPMHPSNPYPGATPDTLFPIRVHPCPSVAALVVSFMVPPIDLTFPPLPPTMPTMIVRLAGKLEFVGEDAVHVTSGDFTRDLFVAC
jgi:hypothetical protein